MNRIGKLVLGAALASGVAMTAVAPAEAGISIGIGIGLPGPGYHRDWCYYHSGACRPGVYVGGQGYWDGHGWYHHRRWDHGGWHYW